MEGNAKLEINGLKINLSIEVSSIAVTGTVSQIEEITVMIEKVIEKLNQTSQILEKIQQH